MVRLEVFEANLFHPHIPEDFSYPKGLTLKRRHGEPSEQE
jgi:hypothetical protein